MKAGRFSRAFWLGIACAIFALLAMRGMARAAPVANAANTPIAQPPPKAPEPQSDDLDDQPLRTDAPRQSGDRGGDTAIPIPGSGFDAGRVVLALGGVIILIVILRASMKRMFPGSVQPRSSRAVRVIARCPIAPRQHLLLIHLGKRLVMVGDAGAQLNPLCEIRDADEISAILAQLSEESSTVAQRFNMFFGRARESFEADREPSQLGAESDDSESIEIPEPPARARDRREQAPVGLEHASLDVTRSELSGLTQRVRELAQQLGGK